MQDGGFLPTLFENRFPAGKLLYFAIDLQFEDVIPGTVIFAVGADFEIRVRTTLIDGGDRADDKLFIAIGAIDVTDFARVNGFTRGGQIAIGVAIDVNSFAVLH